MTQIMKDRATSRADARAALVKVQAIAALASDSTQAAAASAREALIDRLPRRPDSAGGAEADPHGEIDWDEADRRAVLVAGLVAATIDVVVVGTPQPSRVLFRRRGYAGSPITRWVHPDRHQTVHGFLKKHFEVPKDVPFDARYPSDTEWHVDGLASTTHRVQSLGHDPLLGLPIGLIDIMSARGTYVSKQGKGRRYHPQNMQGSNAAVAAWKSTKHLWSDFYTPAGLPAPLLGLLAFGLSRAQFSPDRPETESRWARLAIDMYGRGYDFRHFLVSATVPLTVEAIIRAYWRMTASVRPVEAGGGDRLALMLLQGQGTAFAGDVIKVGFVFDGEPTALNWALLLTMPVAATRWVWRRTH